MVRIERTHYRPEEFFAEVQKNFPVHVSAMVTLYVERKLGIRPVHAGCDRLYRAEDLPRLIEGIKQEPLEERNGFLVLQEPQKMEWA